MSKLVVVALIICLANMAKKIWNKLGCSKQIVEESKRQNGEGKIQSDYITIFHVSKKSHLKSPYKGSQSFKFKKIFINNHTVATSRVVK